MPAASFFMVTSASMAMVCAAVISPVSFWKRKLTGKVDVRINSNGGEVYSGIAIFNALKNSKADITIYVDGIAASMASVIALCGKPVQMSRYAV